MTGPWSGGLQIRGLDRGETPVADLYCAVCRQHERVTGRVKVAAYLHGDPLAAHQATCSPTPETVRQAEAA